MDISSEQKTVEADETTLLVGDSLPKAMGPKDMQRAFGVSAPTFYRLQRQGAYRPFEFARRLGPNRYSGERVQAFLNGRAS